MSLHDIINRVDDFIGIWWQSAIDDLWVVDLYTFDTVGSINEVFDWVCS